MIIRRADANDLSFLAVAAAEAEKSGTSVFTYQTLFGLLEEEALQYIQQMMEEEIEGQELCLSGFLLAEEKGQRAGAVNAWIEGAGGQPAAMLKSSLMYHILGRERLMLASRFQSMLEQMHIERSPGYLQIESVYTAPAFRGRGIAGKLIRAHIRECLEHHSAFEGVEIQLMSDNQAALAAYQSLGFTVSLVRECSLPGCREVFPSASRVLLTMARDRAAEISIQP